MDFDVTIIGAGVIGLAIAEEISSEFPHVLLLEKNTDFGQETSSHNSEVIHRGIHYPARFFKSSFCIEGNRLLYELCRKRCIPHERLGKLIVAFDEEQEEKLWELRKQAEQKGINDLSLKGESEIRAMEPEAMAKAALFSPATGIIDSHTLLRSFLYHAEANGLLASFRSEVTGINQTGKGYELEVNGGEYRVRTRVIINSAGLAAARIAAWAGADIDAKGYRLKYCKGNYFTASPAPKINHLIYPVPSPHNESLGIHATLDLGGRVRFGPDSRYVERPDYIVDEGRRAIFHEAIRRYLPALREEALSPDMCGIRPKLQGPGEEAKDFIIVDETQSGLPGMINLIGIESPGLTACIPIARHVSALVQPYL